MSNKTVETDTPVTTTPQPPPWELPSLDRIRTQAIMAAILFASRGRSYKPINLKDTMYTEDLGCSVAIARDLLERIEQQERHFIEDRLIDESRQPDTVEPQN
jgi:hypothetical protein